MRKISLLLITLAIAITAGAKPRADAAMLRAAQAQLMANYASHGLRAPQAKPALLRTDSCYRIYGYAEGAFVVVSTDDLMPDVLGYSDADANYSGSHNPNFEWWLQSVRRATRQIVKSGRPLRVPAPDTSLYPAQVGALVTAKWGQETPFNDLCPDAPYSSYMSGTGTARALTGCVATAMAQILYYHHCPAHGVGTHSVGVPFDYPTKTYTVNFGEANYDYESMLDSYNGNYTTAQANAVATLMYHCGVAADMQYAPDGSGTYTKNAADGLKRNFGLSEEVHVVDRADYSDADWMDMVYNEVSNGRPILYTGVSGWDGGHAFVLDGYDQTGHVHINWGWNGEDNGMFDITTLQVETYSFSGSQDMCIGISPEKAILGSDTITLATAGTLADSIPDSLRTAIGTLRLAGRINSSDIRLLRFMAGVDEQGHATKGQMSRLDLSGATIVAGGEPYLVDGDRELTTTDNALPERAFYGARRLSIITLPSNLSHIGDGALAAASLREINITPAADADYTISGQLIRSKADSTDLICVLPTATGFLSVPRGTKTIHDYALANCRAIGELSLPQSTTTIGRQAFANMVTMDKLRLYCAYVPTTGSDALDGVDFANCKLYVRAGSKTKFRNHEQWGRFLTNNYDNIIEFGTRIRARNAFKLYGDPVPALGWRVEGDRIHGEPELSTDVNEQTPVGRYPIHVGQGTIAEEGVDLQDGYIIVAPDTLTATVGDYTRMAGQPDPEFVVVITGFDNGEDASVLTEMPVAQSTATASSPAGEYVINVSGGQAQNYIFRYVAGKLTITGAVDGISSITGGREATADIYSVSGQLVRSKTRSLDGLAPGLYIVNGKKVVVRTR